MHWQIYVSWSGFGNRTLNTPNEWRLIGIALLVTFIISGFASQIGVLVGPVAEAFNLEFTSVAAQFTFLTGGMFIGMILPFVIFDHVRIRTVLIVGYSLIFLMTVGLAFKNDVTTMSMYLGLVGTLLGITMCAGGAVVAQTFFEKKRQTVLVAQDATYNLAGAIFPITTSFLLAKGLSWTWAYVSVGFFILIIVLLAAISRFDFDSLSPSESESKVEWNVGIYLAGVCLFLFMLAQITLVTWLPQYAEQRFSIPSDQSGELIANLYTAALISALVSVYVVHKVKIIYYLYFVVSLGLLSVLWISQTDSGESLFRIAYLLGISVSATFNSLLAYGLLFIAKPKHKNVTFLYFVSGLGTALAPLVSSATVKQFSSTSAAITLCILCYSGILFILLFDRVSSRQIQYSRSSA